MNCIEIKSYGFTWIKVIRTCRWKLSIAVGVKQKLIFIAINSIQCWRIASLQLTWHTIENINYVAVWKIVHREFLDTDYFYRQELWIRENRTLVFNFNNSIYKDIKLEQ